MSGKLSLLNGKTNHFFHTLPDMEARLPLEALFGSCSVWSTTLRVIDGHVFVYDVDALGEGITLFLLHLLDNVLDHLASTASFSNLP